MARIRSCRSAAGANLANYTVVYNNGTLTVGQTILTVTAANANRTYGAANPTFSASATGAVNGDTFTFTESTTASATSPVGTYPIVPVAAGTNLANYTVVYNNGTLTVGQATLTVTAANASRTYGAPNPAFSASASGAVNGDTFTFTESTTATATSPVGTYPIVPVAAGTNLSDYTVVYNNGTLTVGQATLTVTAADASRTYGAPNPTFSVSSTGAVNGDTFTLSAATAATPTSVAGTYPIVPTATGTNLANYTVVYVNGTLTVGQATLTVTAANASRTYGAPNPTFTASAIGAVNGDTFTFTESTTATATSPVGTYPIVPVATGANLANYTVVYDNGTLTVGQATLIVTAANANRAYGAANPAFTASATGAANGDTFTFTESTTANATSPVGTYPIVPVATGTNLSDYTVVYNNGTLTVGQATLTVTAANASRTYGTPNPTFSASATGAANGDTFSFSGTTTATNSSPVGTYPIVPVVTGTNLANYAVIYNNGTLTVGQATLTVTAANANRTYGAANPVFTASATGAVNGDTFTFVESTTATATSPVGTYPIVPVATGTNLGDYTVIYNNGTLTVGQATLTVTAANANRTYGAANPVFTASATGAVNGDTFTFVESTTATATSPVGNYPIVPVATGTNLGDYTVVYNNGTLTVGQATLTVTAANANRTYGAANPTFSASAVGAVNGDTFTFTETTPATTTSPVGTYPIVPVATGANLSDYAVVYNNGTLTVGQATLTVTAANANRTYGAANPTFSASAVGAVNGDTFTFTETTPATATSPVGTYPIVPVAAGTNLSDYAVVYNNGTLTVGQATLTVTAANANRTYGAANPTFSASAVGAVNGDTFTFTETTPATTASPVGTYPIVPVATGTNLSDYTVVYNNGTLTVGQATLTVTAANANRTYGAANPTFTASAVGAVNGDTFTLTESTTATPASPVGTYAIVPVATGTNLSDYTVVYNNGTLTVDQATLTVTAANANRTYGAANPTFSASAIGAVNGDTFTLTESTTATPASPVGNYPIVPVATGTNLSDYAVVYNNGTLTVGQATLTVTAANATRTYGAANPTFSASAIGAVNGDTFTFTESTTATAASPVGTYSIVPVATGTNLSDYAVVYNNGTLTIGQATLTVTAANASRVYGIANPAFSASAAGAVNGDTFTFTESTPATTTSSVGTYPIVPIATGTNLSDYAVIYVDGALTIGQATPSITWANPAPVVYGTALGIAQLDATASVPGTLVYTPAAGTIPQAGNDTLSVTFTPTDSIDYTTATKSVQLTVNQATPVITWANPANIVYGTALSNVQLDATASVDGTFVYTPPAGTEFMVGSHQLSVTFTPTDLADYTTATKTVSINVTQATLTVAANNFTRLYGTPNPTFTGSVTGAQNGDTFTESFSNSATTLSTVGQYPIIPSVAGTNLADYIQVVQNGTLSITKAPALTTTTLSTTNIAYDLPVTVNATVASTTSGTPTGTVSFFDNGTPLGTGTLSNGTTSYTTTSLSVGTHVITAIYSGDVNFSSSTASGTSGTNTVLITPLDFSIQLTSQATVEGTYGSTRTFTFHIAPIGGTYPGVVQLSASPTGPILATYTFSPNSIGKVAGPMDVTLTVATQKLASSEPKGWPSRISPISLGLFLLPLLGLRYSRRSAGKLSRILTYSALLLMSLGAIGTVTGCASGYNDHNYPITITATSNGIQHTVSVDYHIDQAPQ